MRRILVIVLDHRPLVIGSGQIPFLGLESRFIVVNAFVVFLAAAFTHKLLLFLACVLGPWAVLNALVLLRFLGLLANRLTIEQSWLLLVNLSRLLHRVNQGVIWLEQVSKLMFDGLRVFSLAAAD